MLDLMNRIHPEPELDGFTPRLSHGPKPVIPLLRPTPRPAPAKPDRGPNGERLDLLRLVARATEDRPEERFNQLSFCDTACCMAGSYVYANPGCGLRPLQAGEWSTIVPEDWTFSFIEQAPPNVYATLGSHFGISIEESQYLFGMFGPTSKAGRLSRLNDFIADKEAEQPAEPPHEMEFSADDGYAGPVRDPSPAPEDRDGGSYARALRIELNAALFREGELVTANARLRGERDDLARELSRRAMARA